jgi:hypothetical protein
VYNESWLVVRCPVSCHTQTTQGVVSSIGFFTCVRGPATHTCHSVRTSVLVWYVPSIWMGVAECSAGLACTKLQQIYTSRCIVQILSARSMYLPRERDAVQRRFVARVMHCNTCTYSWLMLMYCDLLWTYCVRCKSHQFFPASGTLRITEHRNLVCLVCLHVRTNMYLCTRMCTQTSQCVRTDV